MTPCINLYPTTACDAKNDNRKQNTIASYAMKKFGIEYQGFLLRFCTHRNYFNCVFRSTKLRKYTIRSLIWSYELLQIATQTQEEEKPHRTATIITVILVVKKVGILVRDTVYKLTCY